ncbi:MAG: DUF4387 family protein [Chloroflexi bacterium]|nr:DUF4387 family protein [Chloroflexota bacterium]
MTRIVDLAEVIRSQRAGIYCHSIDIVFRHRQDYERVKAGGAVTQESIARLYHTSAENIRSLEYFDAGKAIKIVLLRPGGTPSGGHQETDVLGVSQYLPLEDLDVP